jgi:hypothetical protein
VVPIEYRNVSPDLVLGEEAPAETRVTLSGTDPAFRLLEPSTLKISIDLAGVGKGVQTVPVEPTDLSVPANLSLYGIEHSAIRLNLHPRPPKPKTPEPVPDKAAAS